MGKKKKEQTNALAHSPIASPAPAPAEQVQAPEKPPAPAEQVEAPEKPPAPAEQGQAPEKPLAPAEQGQAPENPPLPAAQVQAPENPPAPAEQGQAPENLPAPGEMNPAAPVIPVPGENKQDTSDVGATLEIAADDDDEILDEIKPKDDKVKQTNAEQYKKDFTRNQVEAVLFVSGQAVSAEEISVKLGVSKKVIEDNLEKLAMEYLERSSALEIAKVAEKYILQLKPEFTSSVKSFASSGLIREAVMRTLTVIAAKQPILQSDLSKIRSAAGEHLKELIEMGVVKATPKGRSRELVTTDKFADMFGFSRDVAKMKEQIKIYLTAATKEEGE
nr:SMC-Scp complex subunit ScpB [Candidatus Sigynarchaeota archaeon]